MWSSFVFALSEKNFIKFLGLLRGTVRLGRWQESGTDPSWNIIGYFAMRRCWRLPSTISVTAQPLVGWGEIPLARASLRVWILCRESISRLSLDFLLAPLYVCWSVLFLRFLFSLFYFLSFFLIPSINPLILKTFCTMGSFDLRLLYLSHLTRTRLLT